MSERIDTIVKEILGGNINNFEEITRTYYPQIFAIVQSLHPDRATINDVIQEVFLTIYNKLHCYKIDTHFLYWIKSIARKTCYNSRRKWFKKINDEKKYWQILQDDAKTPEILHFNIMYDRILKSMQLLKPKYKDTLRLFYYQNKSIKDISKKHQISEEQVKIRLYRGRKLIESNLKEDGVIK